MVRKSAGLPNAILNNPFPKNHNKRNKTVQKLDESEGLVLSQDQYENILASTGILTQADIENRYIVKLRKGYINDLRNNKLPEYKDWYSEYHKRKNNGKESNRN